MNFSELASRQKHSALLLASLCVSNVALVIILALTLMSTRGVEVQTHLLPPFPVAEEIVLAQDTFNSAYAEPFGLMIANLVGNVRPENVDSTVRMLSRIMHHDLFDRIRQQLHITAETMKIQGYKLNFRPNNLSFNEDSRTVYVSGDLTETPVRGEPNTSRTTYEITFAMQSGILRITDFLVCAGGDPCSE